MLARWSLGSSPVCQRVDAWRTRQHRGKLVVLLIHLEVPVGWCRELTIQIARQRTPGLDAQHSEVICSQLHFQGHSTRLLTRWWIFALNFYLGPH